MQVKGEKGVINHKHIKLNVPASELYSEDYDFSIAFDSKLSGHQTLVLRA